MKDIAETKAYTPAEAQEMFDAINRDEHDYEISEDWMPYPGYYVKEIQAIRVQSGKEFDETYPNAGKFTVLTERNLKFDESEVTHIKKTVNGYK